MEKNGQFGMVGKLQTLVSDRPKVKSQFGHILTVTLVALLTSVSIFLFPK